MSTRGQSVCSCGSVGRARAPSRRALSSLSTRRGERSASRDDVSSKFLVLGGGEAARSRKVVAPLRCSQKTNESSPMPSTTTIALDNYTDIVNNMAKSVLLGLKDNLTRMEVEFPPVLESDAYKNSSDVYIDANVQFAIALGRVLQEYERKVKIILPDENEVRRAEKIFGQALDMYENISLGSLTGRGDVISDAIEGVKSAFSFLDGQGGQKSKELDDEANTYIVINASCSELLDLRDFVNKKREALLEEQGGSIPLGWEEYKDEKSGRSYYYDTRAKSTTWERPVENEPAVILMNLELETLRGDLGLIAFPPKEMHWEFLSSFKPVYFIRQRDYSKTITESPYLVNYSGAIYREYPGDWQVLLEEKLGGRKYRPIRSSEDRYTLFEAKETMMEEMGLKSDETPALKFLRTGYQTCTWWEDPKDYDRETSDNWRK
ncbi:protein LOW PSII ACCUMULATION 3 [Chloropicon primus]|uniref:WW domain-containing protein n=1 Tax=Chloropicon primus TaxID=1764295 RepID=A0A5B8MUH2_9CHLO|nr:hypothetical protein A3770_12p65450 [Chloropicon primus]UPR03239.1 protein LOW PSII ACCUMULATION 3 [Chloropicon primus]|eukprot:QDZ24027.1 hypothetical protein A3770_12p65450 [Chloropicon primus]